MWTFSALRKTNVSLFWLKWMHFLWIIRHFTIVFTVFSENAFVNSLPIHLYMKTWFLIRKTNFLRKKSEKFHTSISPTELSCYVLLNKWNMWMEQSKPIYIPEEVFHLFSAKLIFLFADIFLFTLPKTNALLNSLFIISTFSENLFILTIS